MKIAMKRRLFTIGIILLALFLVVTCDIESPFVDLIQGKIDADLGNGEDGDIPEEEVTPVAVTEVNLDINSCAIVTGGTGQLTATVGPADAENQVVTWTSSNEAIATVDSSGTITAVGVGNATITVTIEDGGFTDACSILVPKLTASDAAACDYFGRSVSVSSDYALVGANYDNDGGTESGSAYLFEVD